MKLLNRILALVLIAIMVNSNMISLNALGKRSRASISRLGVRRNHHKSKTSEITLKEYGLFFLNVIGGANIPVVSDIVEPILQANDLKNAIFTGDTCTVEALGKLYSNEVNKIKIAQEDVQKKNDEHLIAIERAFEDKTKEGSNSTTSRCID